MTKMFKEDPDMEMELKETMLNQLDEEKTRDMRAAEKKCAKTKKIGIYFWSPILASAGTLYSQAKKQYHECVKAKASSVAIAFAKEDRKKCEENLAHAQLDHIANRKNHN